MWRLNSGMYESSGATVSLNLIGLRRFLYMLLLALDANFRLKNRLRANEHQDVSLGSGMGYFVEEAGFKEHLKNYVAEKDVCAAFFF
jgi:hypothetical protein